VPWAVDIRPDVGVRILHPAVDGTAVTDLSGSKLDVVVFEDIAAKPTVAKHDGIKRCMVDVIVCAVFMSLMPKKTRSCIC